MCNNYMQLSASSVSVIYVSHTIQRHFDAGVLYIVRFKRICVNKMQFFLAILFQSVFALTVADELSSTGEFCSLESYFYGEYALLF